MNYMIIINESSIRLNKVLKSQIMSITKEDNGYIIKTNPNFNFKVKGSYINELKVNNLKELRESFKMIKNYIDPFELKDLINSSKINIAIKNYKFAVKYGNELELIDCIQDLTDLGINYKDLTKGD